MSAGDPVRRERFVREVFGQLRSQDFSHTRSVIDLTSRVGQAVLQTGDPSLIGVLARELLDIDFHYPDFAGFTDEWGVRVDPGHLENIRAYMRIIEVDPPLSRSLLAALVVHLKVGGVFIADTDLFQRDVSRLLAGSIEPVYDQVKHLLKLLPVYFQDIGAEGDLRDVSTRLDEICGRRDPLCHFVRKQSHVECNPLLVELVVETARFWRTGDPAGLRDYVPQSLYDHLDIGDENYGGLHRLFVKLADSDRAIEELFGLDPDELRERLDRTGHDVPTDVEKAELLFGVHREISRKYSLDHRGIADRLRAYGRLDGAMIRGLEQSLESGDHQAALDHVLRILEDLRQIILDEGETRAIEDIYLKRHIAVGIPSMYGSYREPRFEAMGLTFRLESLGTSLFDHLIEDPVAPLSLDGLRQAMSGLRSLIRALRIDGYDVQGLVSCMWMLEQAVDAPEVGGDQYRDVLQLFCRQIEALTQNRLIDVYLGPVETLVARMMENGPLTRGVEDGQREGGEERREQVLKFSERFLRTLIAESFGLQRLDNLASRLLRQLREQTGILETGVSETGAAGTASDGEPESWMQPIEAARGSRDGIIHLGNKGFLLKRMTKFGLPVPGGFILTTDLFRARDRLGSDRLRAEVEDRMRAGVLRLERVTGYRFGDPSKPLLLSVRGGGPISMPGMLDSFLNVGISPEIAAAVASTRGHAWAAWDSYRRFTQLWGMSHGIERDLFDDLIREAKQAHSVPKKAMLTAEQMRELAFRYRELLVDEGIQAVDDPTQQLLGCIGLALDSWDSENARLYRREVQISDTWGTAVIVQNMVFGNLSERSGTGVLMARRVAGRSEELRLAGDFVVKGQGDDVVSGLVETFPITESQRRSHPVGADHSLERDFPEIYRRLSRIARSLVLERGFADQEIEFTFESNRPDDLFILQTRDAILSRTTMLAAFQPSEALEASRAAIGVGVSGGALSGRVAHDASDIEALKRRYPDDPLILLRPDTVPDDIALVLQTDGVLTAIGGATSHAAVVARRLGKTSVVGCRSLEVIERAGYSTVGSQRLETGDLISINGMDGSVYFGKHPVTMIRVRGLTH
jgi:pyruvate,orthophosphate dikinase